MFVLWAVTPQAHPLPLPLALPPWFARSRSHPCSEGVRRRRREDGTGRGEAKRAGRDLN